MKLLSSRAQGHNDFWKPSESCHVGIHWIALAEYPPMRWAGFGHFSGSFASLCNDQISHQQHIIRVKLCIKLTITFHIHVIWAAVVKCWCTDLSLSLQWTGFIKSNQFRWDDNSASQELTCFVFSGMTLQTFMRPRGCWRKQLYYHSGCQTFLRVLDDLGR